ncbi:efflux transporter outer membrane subunit [Gluconobacter cerinus]|uniref:efflux transporter outer membrane subunit n=1 Tax=Gluconobacter cerinus TaxID=38307 RepID=UPI001C0514DD|nr:efflux transporter outer membrane subunit [Gluconobacter cerinus]
MPKPYFGSKKAFIVLCAAIIGLDGCTMGPNFVSPKPVLANHWQNAAPTLIDQHAEAQWWTVFNSPCLNTLIRRSESGNPDLAMSRERIRAARIQRGAASAESLPTLNGQAAYSRERLATAGIGQVLQPLLGLSSSTTGNEPEGVSYNNYNIGAVASWELDLWGHQRRLQEAAASELLAVEADADAMRLSNQAEIARTYFQWLDTNERLERSEETLDIAQKLLSIAQTVRAHGLLATIDLDEQNTFYRTAQAERDKLAAQKASLYRALSTLVAGRPDAAMPELDAKASLHDIKIPEISAGVPSEMVRKRPDIRAAEARLHAATAAIGMAKADFYPQLTLTGQFSLDALTIAELGWNARNTSFGPTLSLPIFNGMRLSRQLELRHSEQRSAGLYYQSTVLNAWFEVENLLANRTLLQKRHKSQNSLSEAKEEKIQILEKLYHRGEIAQKDLFTSEISNIEFQNDRTGTLTARLINAVDLTTALGQ